MDIAIKIGLFILGMASSVLLVPRIEKKSDFQRKDSLCSLFAELEDIQNQLNEHIEQHFNFLFNLRSEPKLARVGKIPIAMPSEIDVTMLLVLYKKTSIILTSDQRILIKRVSSSVDKIMKQSQNSVDCFVENDRYYIQSIKNTIKLACLLVFDINHLTQERERFKRRNDLDSNKATNPVLRSLGFTDNQINISRISESQFKGLNVEM